MRIVFEIDSVLRERHSGFFTYGAGLLWGMSQLTPRPELTLFCHRHGWEARNHLADVPDRLNARWAVSRLKLRQLQAWWRICDWPALQRFTGPFDLYHANHHLMPPTCRRPRIMTVHDLRRYRYPDLYLHSKLVPFEHAIKTADHFIAISHATKRDLMELFRIPEERIDVVYHGGPLPLIYKNTDMQQGVDGSGQLQSLNLTPGRYFVVFSSYDKRKNLPNTIKAFESAARKLPDDFRLVVIGRLPTEDMMTPSDKIIITGPLSSFDTLLENACGMLFASLYEGFGLPILEAMSAGCPIITSNCSSMPEVAGDAALFVDPKNPDSIAAAITKLADDQTLRQQLIAAGHKRSANFSWERAARETFSVYQALR